MTDNKHPEWPDYFKLSQQATSTLDCEFDDLKEKFPDKSIFSIKHRTKKGVWERIAEIRFDEDKATVTCHFNDSGICYGAYIFFDEENDINSYIEFICRNFVYNYSVSRWLVHSSLMSIQKVDEIIGFMFCNNADFLKNNKNIMDLHAKV